MRRRSDPTFCGSDGARQGCPRTARRYAALTRVMRSRCSGIYRSVGDLWLPDFIPAEAAERCSRIDHRQRCIRVPVRIAGHECVGTAGFGGGRPIRPLSSRNGWIVSKTT